MSGPDWQSMAVSQRSVRHRNPNLSFPDSERFCSDHALPLSSGEPDLDGLVRGELTGHVLDRRYLLGGVLGAGGMGTVYATRNLRNGHGCAVKVLLPELCRDGRIELDEGDAPASEVGRTRLADRIEGEAAELGGATTIAS